jgi:SAM-dependent methyltransferase
MGLLSFYMVQCFIEYFFCIFSNRRRHNNLDSSFYTDGKYFEQNPTWDIEDSPWKADKIAGILNRNALRPKSVLEVGCGAGEILVQLQKKLSGETTFMGMDISSQAITLASKHDSNGMRFRVAEFPEREEHFDLSVCADVFEHVDNPIGFLRILRLFSDYAVFHIPLDISAQSVWRVSPILDRRRDVGHLHYFSKETALAILQDTGYEIIDWEYTGSSVDMPSESVKSWLMKWPRKVLFRLNSDWAVRVLGGYSLLVLAKTQKS